MEFNVPNIKQSFNIEYKYYANNTVVHCIITPKYPLDYLYGELFLNYKSTISTVSAEVACSGLHYFWEGRAILKPGDTMDIHAAEEIARKKALRSYYNEVKCRYREIWEKIEKIAKERLAYVEKVEAKASELTREILEITRENN